MPFANSAGAASPWRARFVQGGFDGAAYQAGFLVGLDVGWKTYWRNPGESGIPPQITIITAENLQNLEMSYPLPKRFIDESGESIGYHDEVLFPLRLQPKDFSKPLKVKFEAFFGVCFDVCVPAKDTAELEFNPSSLATPDAELIANWIARVPKPAVIVKAISITEKSLVLDLTKPYTDLFVEGPARYYFTKPDFAREPGKAWIAIKGLKNTSDLKQAELRITASDNGQGLEQVASVP